MIKSSALTRGKRSRGRPAAPIDTEVVKLFLQPKHRAVFYKLGNGNISLGARIAAELLNDMIVIKGITILLENKK